MNRGEIWWADLEPPTGSGRGYRRPVLVLQADEFNRSTIPTVICVVITSNLRLADLPGNTLLQATWTGLPRDSVANVSQIVTLDRAMLTELAGSVSRRSLESIEAGVRLVLGLKQAV